MSRRLRRVGSLIALPVVALSLAACGGELPGMAAGPPEPDSTLPTPAEMLRQHCLPKTLAPPVQAYEDRVTKAARAFPAAGARVKKASERSDRKAMLAAVRHFEDVDTALIKALDGKQAAAYPLHEEFAELRAAAVLWRRAMQARERAIFKGDAKQARAAERLGQRASAAFAKVERDIEAASRLPQCPE